jgi:hypothetical protein
LDVVYGQQGEREYTMGEALKEEKFVENIRQVHFLVDETLKKSQEKYKDGHNQHRIEKSFKVGDNVWLRLNNKRLQGPRNKIKALQYGPFEILDKVGDNSYKLSLPPIHAYLLNSECGEYQPLQSFHVGSKGGVGLTIHRGLSTRCLGRVGRGHLFTEVVQNYKIWVA